MPYWMFTEDLEGRYGCLGYKESKTAAMLEEDEYDGVVHINFYDTYNRAEAKQYFRAEMAKKKGLSEGYRNVRNEVSEEVE